jgi:hypothetical protein
MIAHRAACFEGNSALIYQEKRDFSGCLRSTWTQRAELSVAKIAGKLNESLSSSDFPGLLLSKGVTQDDDDFVEVHVFGTMTAQTFQSVAIDRSKLSREQKTLWKAVKEKLAKNGVVALER